MNKTLKRFMYVAMTCVAVFVACVEACGETVSTLNAVVNKSKGYTAVGFLTPAELATFRDSDLSTWQEALFLSYGEFAAYTPVKELKPGESPYVKIAFKNTGTKAISVVWKTSVEIYTSSGTKMGDSFAITNTDLDGSVISVPLGVGMYYSGYRLNLRGLSAGSYVLRVTLDYTNKLDDPDRSDNVAEYTFSIRDASATRYTVEFGKNGGTGGSDAVTATSGQAMPKITPPTRPGYAFAGYWTTTGTGGVKYYNADGTSARNWDKTLPLTLWAKWELVQSKIILGKNGGLGGDNYVTVSYGAVPHDVRVPAKSGSTFGGYWTTCSDNGVQYFSALGKGVRAYDKTGDVTLWAKWWNTITFGKNGGTGGDNKVTVIYGQVPHKVTPPTKAGYVFDGYWTTLNNGVQCYTADGQATKMWTGEKNTTYWAKWVAGTGYKVVFGLNGGTGGAYVYAVKGKAMPRITPPKRSGYAFGGYWTTTGTGGVQYYKADGSSARAWDKAAGTTLYAKWTKVGACVKAAPAQTAPVALSVPTCEILNGCLADGTGTYCLLVDANGATGFVSIEMFDGGTLVAEVAIEIVDDEIVLVTADGEMIPLVR